MVGTANHARNDCIFKIFEDITIRSFNSVAKILILLARRIEGSEGVDVLGKIPLVGLLQRAAFPQPIGTTEPTLDPAPLLSLHGCVTLAIVCGDAHLALVSLNLGGDAILVELGILRRSTVLSL